MEYLLIFFYGITWFICFIFCVSLFDIFSYWAHRKGYPKPGWKFLVNLPSGLGLLGLTLVFAIGGSRILNDWYTLSAASYFGLYLWFFVPILPGIAGSFLIFALLPKRKMRTAETRRTEIYGVLGYAVAIIGGILFITAILLQTGLSDILQMLMAAAALSGSMFYLDRRAKTSTVQEAIWHDQRLPVLYLRSFDQEGNYFVKVSHEDAKEYSEITSYASNLATYNLTLEQFLSREINRSIGPFIALGNPEDYLPPEGAYRSYASDASWQDFFTNLSDRSAAILLQMGNSDNLNWELVSIRERGLQEKLFVVTPPDISKGSKNSIAGFSTKLINRIKGIQPATWDRFVEILTKAGYQPPAKVPDPGSVVTFDEHDQGLTLVSGAKAPVEYIQAICERLGFSPEMPRYKFDPNFKWE